MQIKMFLILISLLFLPLFSLATPNVNQNKLTIEQILAEFGENVNVGVVIYDLKTKAISYQKNPSRYFVPASQQKLLTAFAVLNSLGPQFRYQTQVILEPKNIVTNTYHGDIYLRFSGDPLLTSNDLDALLIKLRQAGINRIEGQLKIDDTALDQDYWPPGANWDERYGCYAAPVSALNINRNCVNNKTVQKPRAAMQALLTQLLTKNQIIVTARTSYARVPNRATPWLIHYSSYLPELLTSMLHDSDNVIANTLFKTMGARLIRGQGNWKNGRKAMQSILSKHLKIRFLDEALQDGAGVSQYTQITPYQLSVLLTHAYHQPYFVNALPSAGNAPNTINKIRAKSSNDNAVSALSGYLQTNRQQTLAFVMMINGFVDSPVKYQQLQNKICLALIG